MGVDFKKALTLPYQAAYRNQLVFIATGVMILSYMIVIIPTFMVSLALGFGAILAGHHHGTSPIVQLVSNLISMVVFSFPLGYQWRFLAHLQSPETISLPKWLDDPLAFWKDGLKLNLYFYTLSFIVGLVGALVVGIPLIVLGVAVGLQGLFSAHSNHGVTLVAIVLVCLLIAIVVIVGIILLGPFYWGPVIYSAQTRTLASLFSWQSVWRRVKSRYWQGVLAMVMLVGLTFVYGIAIIISFLTVIGWIFLIFPSQISGFILINDALWDRADGESRSLAATENPPENPDSPPPNSDVIY